MKKATLQKMHDQSFECGMRLDMVWAIARVLSECTENPDIPKWAIKDSIGAMDHLIGESKSQLTKIGIELENELYK